MSIGLVTEIEKGQLIVGVVDSSFFSSPQKIYGVNQEILIQSLDKKYIFKVKDVKVSTSLTNKSNVAYLICKSEDFYKLKCGDKIYVDV